VAVKARTQTRQSTIAIVGNPNVGKSELFNALTGLNQVTGNYPGVTVERKRGAMTLAGDRVHLLDLPGAYSLAARSPDEMIVTDVLLGQQRGEDPVDAILVVVDASNLERNLYLISQIQELGRPMVVALNMMDIAERRGLAFDLDTLSRRLAAPVVPVLAHKRKGLDHLKAALHGVLQPGDAPAPAPPQFPEGMQREVHALAHHLNTDGHNIGRTISPSEAFRVIVDHGGYAEKRLVKQLGTPFAQRLHDHRSRARTNGSLAAVEAKARYAWAREVYREAVVQPDIRLKSRSERLDYFLTHRLWGSVIFILLMAVVFQAIYAWAAPLMHLIDGSLGAAGDVISARMPEGMLRSLIVDGAIAGVGSVLIFLPQILMLSLFIAILEDCGYMARAAFLMDKLFNWCGLSGQSFIPMMSSFACAIPGIMATRTIENTRDRLTTMLLAPLMSCSARLPVYLIMIGAFIPSQRILGGLIGLEGLTLLVMYSLGVCIAIPMAFLLKKTILKAEPAPFLLELPSYKMPQLRTITRKVYGQGHEFLRRAGTLIFAIAIVVWALAYFPRSESVETQFAAQRAQIEAVQGDHAALLETLDREEAGAQLRDSFLGRMGTAIEPVVRPLGWDWRIGTAVIASFPAREVIVATLGTLFNMGADVDETSQDLRTAMQEATWPGTGAPLFTIPVALSIMVFFALCCQCGATLAMIKRETGMWRWPIYTFTYMTILAYGGAFITYHLTTWLGWGA
jgi:ferrous iron transport protein B